MTTYGAAATFWFSYIMMRPIFLSYIKKKKSERITVYEAKG